MLTHQDERFPCLDATAAEFTRRDINANCITAKLIECPAYRPLNLYHVHIFGSAFENMAQKQVFELVGIANAHLSYLPIPMQNPPSWRLLPALDPDKGFLRCGSPSLEGVGWHVLPDGVMA